MLCLSAPISRYMSSPVHRISVDASLDEAAQRMLSLGIGCLVVADGEAPIGVLSLTDLLRLGRRGASRAELELPEGRCGDVCHQGLLMVNSADPVSSAARMMMHRHVHRVFVLESARLAGVLSTRGVMLAVRDARAKDAISTLMVQPVLSVQVNDALGAAVERLTQAGVRGLVVREGASPVGLFTQIEALESRHQPRDTPVEQVMGHAMLCLPPETPVHRAAGQMAATRARRLLVVAGGQLRGVLSGMDIAALAL